MMSGFDLSLDDEGFYCYACKTIKSRKDFVPSSILKKWKCIECASKYSKAWSTNIRTDVISKYGGICACCGESKLEFLSIDHINNDGAKIRKTGLKGSVFYRYLYKNKKIKGLRVLCHNCNMSFGLYGYCPHKA